MTQIELDEFFRKVSIGYPKYDISSASELWSNVLSQYDAKEVNEMFEFYASKESYKDTVPQVYTIVKNLTKISDKVDFSKQTYFCKHCRKAFNDINQTHEHEDRCSAIKYIERQYKRFNLGNIDNKKKAELYNMPESEFDESYKKILKYVQQNTIQEYEKQLIENIFKPPNMEMAINFLRN